MDKIIVSTTDDAEIQSAARFVRDHLARVDAFVAQKVETVDVYCGWTTTDKGEGDTILQALGEVKGFARATFIRPKHHRAPFGLRDKFTDAAWQEMLRKTGGQSGCNRGSLR
jgi:hypothetical protein